MKDSQKRENGSGSIRQKPNGTIEFRILHDGKRKSFTGRTEMECRRKYREWIKEQTHIELTKKEELSNLTVIDYIQSWAKTFKFGKVKDSTYDRLENTIKHQIEPFPIASMKLTDLTDEIIQNFIDEQATNYSRSTVKKIYEAFNPALKKAYSKQLISTNLMDNVSVPAPEFFIAHPTKKIEIYTDKDIEVLSKAAYECYFTNYKRYRYAPAFILVLNTGIRFGELLALTWKNVNLEKKMIYIEVTASYIKNRNRFKTDHNKVQIITSTKNRQTRYIPLNQSAIKALLELRHRQETQGILSEYVISNLDGECLQGRSVQDALSDICEEHGIEYKGFHALRHTFASKMIKKNVDIGIVSQLLGHSSVKITYDTYIHFIDEQKFDAVEAVDF